MIRIEEIYANTFWSYLRRQVPRTRFWFLDPPGHVGVEYLRSYASSGGELNYLLAFDQEPVEMSRIMPIANHICDFENNTLTGPGVGGIITSEYNSNTVQRLCQLLGWHSFYYFYNGWAALDWFRGYNRTYVVEPYADRRISKTFLSPNRIVAGERSHRLILMYHLLKRGLENNHISFPLNCPAENISVFKATEKFLSTYPDIHDTFQAADLPRSFDEPTVPSYASARLDLHELASESLVYVITETVGTGQRQHLTEKTFKPICLQMPFVMSSTARSLEYLRRYGFETFHDVWDESYDQETDDLKRMERVADLLLWLENTDQSKVFAQCSDIVQHNYNHFYSGAFEAILWQELECMLDDIRSKLFI